ncbi:dihydrofolate reductase family protein [Ginsengibacter hankyongi]|uniref:Dihydrofolate reductase family protein n=1 Tax=Ginsengibacter hankyongi TaxID=2607284 RepID=A0A5J5IGD5_9BACT|nr:dihydrofolate reductase family protein [Ginsengibacter hankyongi]KAA9038411.1 dihydrofolate reductase family protein [Ginsengibacter hankyongi]
MRKLIMKMSITVDGFVAGIDGKADWIFTSSDKTSRAWSLERSYDASMVIMGRKSFEAMAPYWPTAPRPFATPMNEIPKAVFTKSGYKGIHVEPDTILSPAAASWAEAQIFDGDLADEIKELKSQEGKPILALGGAGFMRSLVATGLIDEYHLNMHPVVLGAGMPIFSSVEQPMDLKLIEAKSFPGGIVAHVYSS